MRAGGVVNGVANAARAQLQCPLNVIMHRHLARKILPAQKAMAEASGSGARPRMSASLADSSRG